MRLPPLPTGPTPRRSENLKEKYDETLATRDRAQQAHLQQQQKRKGMAAEKKQYKEQKDEAERFQALLGERSKTKIQHYLCQLFHVEQGAAAVLDSISPPVPRP